MKTKIFLGVLLMLGAVFIAACGSDDSAESSSKDDDEGDVPAHRVMWVDSYHADYDWSLDVEEGLNQNFTDTNVELQIFRMDTKNNDGEEFCMQAGEQALAEIEAYQPEVLIVSDDNAQECLVVPHLMESDIPIVFLGVAWDASGYGYPTDHITGMLEVELVRESFDLIGQYADGDRICLLSPNTANDRNKIEIYQETFPDLNMEIYLVETIDEWKAQFIDCQTSADMMWLGNNASIEGWDDEDVKAFVLENVQIPIAARNEWLAQFALVSLVKRGDEQGEWGSNAVLQILDGTSPADIPVATNKIGRLVINLEVAAQLDIVFEPSLLTSADEIIGAEE